MANEDTSPVQGLVALIAALREHCPWMGALTHESLVEYLLEEAYEVAETIETGAGDAELQSELGDVLLQVVLHARLAEERGAFDLGDVARGLKAKMIRRNPHVFRPDGSLQDSFPATVEEIVLKWDAVKKAEMPERGHVFDGVPAALPALARAQKLLDRAERAGMAAGRRPKPPPEPPSTSRPPRRNSATCCSGSWPLPGPAGSTPNAPSAAPCAGSRTAPAPGPRHNSAGRLESAR